jgi:hypothetical protein
MGMMGWGRRRMGKQNKTRQEKKEEKMKNKNKK